MDTATILALILRHVLTGVGAVAVSKGYVDADTIQTGIGAAATLGGLAWSVIQKYKSGALVK